MGGEDDGGGVASANSSKFKAVYDPANDNGTITVNLPKVSHVAMQPCSRAIIQLFSYAAMQHAARANSLSLG